MHDNMDLTRINLEGKRAYIISSLKMYTILDSLDIMEK